MITVTSVEAQSSFGELIDRSQREPVKVTSHGRTVAYIVSEYDIQALMDLRKRREEAARWYSHVSQLVAQLLNAVTNGEEVIIRRPDGRSFRIVPVENKAPRPRFGSAKELIEMAESFDEPLEYYAC